VEESNSWENEWLTPESDSATIPDTRFQTQPDQNMFAPSTSTQTTINQNMVAPSIRPKKQQFIRFYQNLPNGNNQCTFN